MIKNYNIKLNKTLLIIFFLFNYYCSFSQDLWTNETADNLDKFNFRIGAFQASRAGLTDRIEFSSNALNNIFSQNIAVKFKLRDRKVIISTKHGINYPKLGLNVAKNTKFRKWISDTTIIPDVLVFKNELLISKYFKTCQCCNNVYLITYKFGVTKNLYKNNLPFQSIKHPLLNHRTEIYNNSYLWNLGIDMQGPFLFEWLEFIIDFDYFRIFATNTEAIEHKTMIRWKFSEKFNFFGGYKIAFNSGYEGKNFLFFPLVDAVYIFNIPVKPKNGLFKGRINRKYS